MAKTKKPRAQAFRDLIKWMRRGKSLGFGRDKARKEIGCHG